MHRELRNDSYTHALIILVNPYEIILKKINRSVDEHYEFTLNIKILLLLIGILTGELFNKDYEHFRENHTGKILRILVQILI